MPYSVYISVDSKSPEEVQRELHNAVADAEEKGFQPFAVVPQQGIGDAGTSGFYVLGRKAPDELPFVVPA